MYLEVSAPLSGRKQTQWLHLLEKTELRSDPNIESVVCLYSDDGQMVGTAALSGSLICCVAIDPEHQGEGLLARIITALTNCAHDLGRTHLYLTTKPALVPYFEALGYALLIETSQAALLENEAHGLGHYLAECQQPGARAPISAIVAHCDPFTNGHRHLIETASRCSGHVYVFILSEDRGRFDPPTRLKLAQLGTADLGNVSIHETGPYMVSSALFPSYFIKDATQAASVHGELDLRLFGARIAPGLGITRRYVGTEPLSAVTADYNRRMHAVLAEYGIETIEIARIEKDGAPVSASRVRRLYEAGDWLAFERLVPETTYAHLRAQGLR